MTNEEFSNEFDVLLNSYARFKAYDNREMLDSLEFNEYEKSIFLTDALEALVKELYSSSTTGDSIEAIEKIKRSLHPLIGEKDIEITKEDVEANNLYKYKYRIKLKILNIIDSYSNTAESLPSLWYILLEFVTFGGEDKCINGKIVLVVPTTHDAMIKTLNNPFRGTNARRVLRVDAEQGYIELYSNYELKTYHITYLKKPLPIILLNLPLNLSIDGKNEECSTVLPNSMHRNILELAVRLAIQSKLNSLSSNSNQESNNNKNAE